MFFHVNPYYQVLPYLMIDILGFHIATMALWLSGAGLPTHQSEGKGALTR